MSAHTLLARIRTYALWGALGSAPLLLILNLLETWGAISTHDAPGFGDMMGGLDMGSLIGLGGLNAWGKIEGSLGAILGICAVVLLVLLVSSKVVEEKAAAKKK